MKLDVCLPIIVLAIIVSAGYIHPVESNTVKDTPDPRDCKSYEEHRNPPVETNFSINNNTVIFNGEIVRNDTNEKKQKIKIGLTRLRGEHIEIINKTGIETNENSMKISQQKFSVTYKILDDSDRLILSSNFEKNGYAIVPSPSLYTDRYISDNISSITDGKKYINLNETTSNPKVFAANKQVFIGEYQKFETSNGCHTIQLVRPKDNYPIVPLDNVLRNLKHLDKNRTLGERHEQVVGFAVPDPNAAGNRAGEASVRQNIFAVDTSTENALSGSPLVQNTWVHEYIHVRTSVDSIYTLGSWYSEGIAKFYESRNHYPSESYTDYVINHRPAPYSVGMYRIDIIQDSLHENKSIDGLVQQLNQNDIEYNESITIISNFTDKNHSEVKQLINNRPDKITKSDSITSEMSYFIIPFTADVLLNVIAVVFLTTPVFILIAHLIAKRRNSR